MADDPEFGSTTPGPCACQLGPRCPCRACHGERWIQVQPAYAAQLVPDPPAEVWQHLSADEAAALRAQVRLRRLAAERHVYPCRVCNERLFFRWAGRHYLPDHDVGGCSECITARGGPRERRMSHAGPRPIDAGQYT